MNLTMRMTLSLACAACFAAMGATAQDRQSLVDPASYRSLAADHRAYRVGDLITIVVSEETSAKSQAATGVTSDVTLHATAATTRKNYGGSGDLGGGDAATAQTTRVGELRTQISAQVKAVRANGLVEIAGVQELTVNGEHQQISVTGVVRPEDIAADNTVPSNRIAQAHLELMGVGVVSESQRQSILYRVLKWMRLM
jgi:flagellar L-ring protein precursor FlgH